MAFKLATEREKQLKRRARFKLAPDEDYLQTVPGFETERGSFVPDLATLYEEQNKQYPLGVPPAAISRRREYAGRALTESLNTEEMLRAHNVEVPELGEENQGLLRYLKWPLAGLKQLQRGQFAVVGGLKGITELDMSQAAGNFYRGLIYAEEHSFGDMLEKWGATSEDHPVLNFTGGLAGDILLDPLTYATLGGSALAKGTALGLAKGTGAALKASELSPHLNRYGKTILERLAKEFGSEDVATKFIIDEIEKGTKLGKKVLPHGIRVAHWVPTIGGTQLGDVFGKTAKHLIPGGVVQHIDDVNASQTILNKITESMLATKPVDWFGRAFVPYWRLRRKYGEFAEYIRAVESGKHALVQDTFKKLQILAKIIPDKADQELLTEFIKDPSRLTGLKFASIRKTKEKVLETTINLDYYPETKKIGEQDSEAIADMFLEVYNNLRSQDPNALLLSHQGARSTLLSGTEIGNRLEPLRPVFETIAAAHPGVDVHNINFGDFLLKIPVPHNSVRWTSAGAFFHPYVTEVLPRGVESLNPYIKDIAGEIGAYEKLAGSEIIPETAVVWRKARDVYKVDNPVQHGVPLNISEFRDVASIPSQRLVAFSNLTRDLPNYDWDIISQKVNDAIAEFGDLLSRNELPQDIVGTLDGLYTFVVRKLLTSRTVDTNFLNAVTTGASRTNFAALIQYAGQSTRQLVPQNYLAWAMGVGGWELYRKGKKFDGMPDDITDFQGFLSWVNQNPVNSSEFPVPMLVKKFIQGKSVENATQEVTIDLIQKANTAEKFEPLERLVDYTKQITNMGYQAARVGMAIGDLHATNVMVKEGAEFATWVDNAFWRDYTRNVVGSEGVVVPTMASFDAVQPTFTNRRFFEHPNQENVEYVFAKQPPISREVARTREEVVQAHPGAPGYQATHPPMYSIKIGPKFAADIDRNTQRLMREASKEALKYNIMGVQGGGPGGALQMGPGQIILGDIFRSLDEALAQLPPDVSKEEYIIKFAQLLKSKGVIKQYSLGNTPLRDIPLDRNEALLQGRLVSKWPFSGGTQLNVAWKRDLKSIMQPIKETLSPEQPARSWYERTAVLVEKHPELVKHPEKFERLMEAYNMTKEWKNDIDAYLRQKNAIDWEAVEKIFNRYGLEYLPIYRKAKSGKELLSAVHKSIKAQKIPAINVEKQGKFIEELNREVNKELYETNILNIMGRYAIDGMLAGGAADVLAQAVRLFGKPAKEVKNIITNAKGDSVTKITWEADAGWETIDHRVTKGIQLPKEVVQGLAAYSRTIGEPVASAFWRKYDDILGIWKGYATFVNLGFHGRNFMSNLWQLHLLMGPDAINPKYHKLAVDVIRGKEGEITLFNGVKMSYKDVFDLMRRHGVYGTGWFSADIQEAGDFTKLLKFMQQRDKSLAKLVNPLHQENLLFQTGKYIGGWVENEARAVAFIHQLMQSGNASFAASMAKKHLFDYTEITDFDKSMKRVMPFWTWLKKNVALQAENIIKQPAKYGNIERFRQNLERQSPGVDERWLPKYFPELYAIRTPLKTKQGSPLYLNPNMPFQDFNRLFDPTDWLSSLAPWKAAVELMVNKNFFTMRDIQNYRGEVVEADWLDYIPTPILNKLGPIIGLSKVYEKETQRWYWGIPPRIKFGLEAANPFLRTMGKAAPVSEESLPFYRREKRPYEVLSSGAGFKLMPYNPTEQVEKKIFERRDVMRDIKKGAERRGQIPSYYLPEGGTEPPKSH